MTEDTARRITTIEQGLLAIVPAEHHDVLSRLLEDLGRVLHDEAEHAREQGRTEGRREGEAFIMKWVVDAFPTTTERPSQDPTTKT